MDRSVTASAIYRRLAATPMGAGAFLGDNYRRNYTVAEVLCRRVSASCVGDATAKGRRRTLIDARHCAVFRLRPLRTFIAARRPRAPPRRHMTNQYAGYRLNTYLFHTIY